MKYSAPSAPFFTYHFSQRVGALIAWSCARRGVAVNLLTISGLPFIILGCLCFAGSTSSLNGILAFLLFQLAYAIDCADGQLARATAAKSTFGAWLDIAVDHARNVMITVSVMFHLIATHEFGPIAGYCVAIFGVGSTVSLHAFAELKSDRPTGDNHDQTRNLKRLVKNTTDTTVVIAMLCLLRPYPEYLMVYIALLGLGNIGSTIVLSKTRLKSVATGNDHG